ncbi:geranylgeranyl reductase family protein [Candidatus Methanoperedens nitroreducens]|uniref:Geranylgeranyl reductase family protein n=1 Tax=Candidatus Methanoperedens nitratireducens TaxID=1392998 RepID=A0A062V2C3_9EURY|nr:NAD(P)/FAD-dependent oxidoreductase [Candidatus Methanoperedens nitroreducens]KCZ70783.1 geranylgeranyl reductase family protein [Candidatus Methanoperedens nitroreducens]MDJ1420638.1 NAD(P)/FAD-dependent oxidoreductase [Candidatus Methanoperedens sp.]
MLNLKSDVAVIGAGPAGSTTARVIAEHGFDVILVEKDEFPGLNNVCAGGTIKSAIVDAGLSSDIIEKEIQAEKYYFPWGENIIETDDLVTVYRHVFDRCLAEKAVEKGATMLKNHQIKDVSVKNDGVHLFSEKNIIQSKLVVFADGPNTLVYRKFGIGFKPESDNTFVSVTCEVKWENNPFDQCEFHYGENIVPWGYGWVFPRKNTVNVGVGCLYSKLSSNLIDSMNYMLGNYPLTGEKFKEKEILQRSSALIPAAPAKRTFGERTLVVGDAAGMVDPVTGGGIIHAINGGKLAGKICALSLEEEDFSARFLSQYQRMWHKTIDYSWIYHKFLASNVFLYLSRFDRNAYPKLAAITREGIGKLLTNIKHQRT